MAGSGVASVYSPGTSRWGGPLAADGRRIDFAALTVAHPLAARSGPMPFGTCLLLTYRGRRVVARVNDNGPHNGRALDLTPGTAKALGFPGLGVVDFEKVDCP